MRPLLVVCVSTFLLAALLRLSYVQEVYGQWRTLAPEVAASREISFLNPDSPSYLAPARAVLEGRLRNAGSIIRPPGYPLFLAALGVRYPVILVAQALLGAAVTVGVVLLVHAVTGHVVLATAAGLLSALSPTGIGLTGLIMSDLLFAATVTAGLGLLVAAGRERSRRLLYGAGAIFGAGALVKPMLLLWPPVAIAMLWLFAGGSLRAFGKRALVLFLALQLAPMAIWSLRNLAQDGVFTLSSSGVITMREYLMSRAEAWAAAGRSPTQDEMRHWRSLAREAGRSQKSHADRLRLYREQTRTIAARHPKETALAYVQDTRENLVGGWPWLETQFPRRGTVYELALGASRWEGWARALVPVLLVAVLFVTALRRRAQRSPAAHQPFADACGMIMAWGYFVVLGGMTYWSGARHMYPTSAAVFATLMLGAASLPGPWRRT